MDPNQNNSNPTDPAAPGVADNNNPSATSTNSSSPAPDWQPPAPNPVSDTSTPIQSGPTFFPSPPDLGGPVSFDPQNSSLSQPAAASSALPGDQFSAGTPSLADSGNTTTAPGSMPDWSVPPATGEAPSTVPAFGAAPSQVTPSFAPPPAGGDILSAGAPSFSSPLPAATGNPTDTPPLGGDPFVANSSSTPLESDGNTAGNTGLEDSVPTDLSHLVSDANTQVTNPQTLPSSAETLVVPQSAEASQVVTGGGGLSFPKWLIVVGVIVFLGVVGGSAYFILGVGKTAEPTNNVTAQPSPAPSENGGSQSFIPPESPVTPSSPSGSLGNLNGNLTPSPAASTSSGTSALELLRQRQSQK